VNFLQSNGVTTQVMPIASSFYFCCYFSFQLSLFLYWWGRYHG